MPRKALERNAWLRLLELIIRGHSSPDLLIAGHVALYDSAVFKRDLILTTFVFIEQHQEITSGLHQMKWLSSHPTKRTSR